MPARWAKSGLIHQLYVVSLLGFTQRQSASYSPGTKPRSPVFLDTMGLSLEPGLFSHFTMSFSLFKSSGLQIPWSLPPGSYRSMPGRSPNLLYHTSLNASHLSMSFLGHRVANPDTVLMARCIRLYRKSSELISHSRSLRSSSSMVSMSSEWRASGPLRATSMSRTSRIQRHC